MSVTILGDKCLHIAADPISENTYEHILKKNITGIYPLKFQQRQVGNTDWTYPFNSITKVCFVIRNGKHRKHIYIELQEVSNQPTWNQGTLNSLNTSVTDINDWLSGGVISSFIVAIGGTITISGNKKIHTFNSSDTFEIISNINNQTVRRLLVAGGGGGGGIGGGGGGGGVDYNATELLVTGSYPVSIGAGGNSVSGSAGGNGGNGSNSTFNGSMALGGGGGGGENNSNGAKDGGCGGGGCYFPTPTYFGLGNPGGNGGMAIGVPPFSDGGGGGSGPNDGADGDMSTGGNGGDGFSSNISGSTILYGGGGGGGIYNFIVPGGVGGNGGGGDGANTVSNPAGDGMAGVDGLGGGGGGSTYDGFSAYITGRGGSGVCVISYQYTT